MRPLKTSGLRQSQHAARKQINSPNNWLACYVGIATDTNAYIATVQALSHSRPEIDSVADHAATVVATTDDGGMLLLPEMIRGLVVSPATNGIATIELQRHVESVTNHANATCIRAGKAVTKLSTVLQRSTEAAVDDLQQGKNAVSQVIDDYTATL